MIHLQCDHCGQKLRVPGASAGKAGRCPKCRNAIVVPEAKPAEDTHAPPINPARDVALLDWTPAGGPRDDAMDLHPTTDASDEDAHEPSEWSGPEEDEPAAPPRRPWPIEAILYPLDLAGIIHLVSLWLLLFLLCPGVIAYIGLGLEYIPVVYALPIAYAVYYFVECIRDSAAGGRHAPDYWMSPADSSKWDCVSQLILTIGCVALCFWPVAVYYIVREQSDWVYWLLMAWGGFVFPMALLAGAWSGTFDGLNPISIVRSILRTFIPYCGMVLLLSGGAWLFVRIDFRLYHFRPLPTLPFLLRVVQLYMIFVAVGLLGGFYRRHKDRLGWED